MTQEFVTVTDPESNESMQLPTEGGQLARNTLDCAFPGACGLKYKNPATGLFHALLLDETGTKFLPPACGWKNKTFTTVKRRPAQNSVPSVPKELKWQQNEYWRSYVISFLYTIPPSKDCVIALSPTIAATFHHGTHQQYIENCTTFDVAPVKLGQSGNITVVVAKIVPSFDLVLLRATNGSFPVVPRIECPRPGLKFCVIGFGHEIQSNETYSYGAVFTNTPHYYSNQKGVRMGPFWLGTAQTSRGDSGGACISSDGYLIGMNVSKTCMPPTYHTNAIAEAALYVPKNAFVSAEIMDNERFKLEEPADGPVQSTSNTEETIVMM